MTRQQKLTVLAMALLAFAMLKILMLLWWQNKQSVVHTLDCHTVATSGCLFAPNASLQLVGVKNNQTPFTIQATGVPSHVQGISASFSMRDMEMGFNRFDLKKQLDGSWQAQNVRLPLCTASRHDWQIEWAVDGQMYRATFQTQP